MSINQYILIPNPPIADLYTWRHDTKEEAWANVYSAASEESPETIQDSWLAAVSEIEENKSIEEDKFTGADWAKVQDIVTK